MAESAAASRPCPEQPAEPIVIVLSELDVSAAGDRTASLQRELTRDLQDDFEDCGFIFYGVRDVQRVLQQTAPFFEGYTDAEKQAAAVRHIGAHLVIRMRLDADPARLNWWFDRAHDFRGAPQSQSIPDLDALPELARDFAARIRMDAQRFLRMETIGGLVRNSLGTELRTQPVAPRAVEPEEIFGLQLIEERQVDDVAVQVVRGTPGDATGDRERPLALIFLIHNSASMWIHDPDTQRVRLVRQQLRSLRDMDRVGLVKFNHEAQEVFPLRTVPSLLNDPQLQHLEGQFFAYGQTNFGDAFELAYRMLDKAPADHQKVIMFITNGQPTTGPNQDETAAIVDRLAQSGIRTHTIGLAKGDGFSWMGDFDPDFLQRLADIGTGRSFSVDAGRLAASVDDLLGGSGGRHTVAEASVDLRQGFRFPIDGGDTARLTFDNLPARGELVFRSPKGKLYRRDIPTADGGEFELRLSRSELSGDDTWVGRWAVMYMDERTQRPGLQRIWTAFRAWLLPAAHADTGSPMNIRVQTEGELRVQTNLLPNYEYGDVRFSVMAVGPFDFTRDASLRIRIVPAEEAGQEKREPGPVAVNDRRNGLFLVHWKPASEGRFDIHLRVESEDELFLHRQYAVAVQRPEVQGEDCEKVAILTESAGLLPKGFLDQPIREYEVKPGDWLTTISRRYLNDQSDFWQIYELNKDQIRHVDQIHVGQIFRLPQEVRSLENWKSQLPEGCR